MATTPIDVAGTIGRKVKRSAVWNVTGGFCFFCGCDLVAVGMTVDHVLPRSRGGADTLDNLVPACEPCNAAKGCMTLDEYRATQDRKTFYGEGRRAMRRLR